MEVTASTLPFESLHFRLEWPLRLMCDWFFVPRPHLAWRAPWRFREIGETFRNRCQNSAGTIDRCKDSRWVLSIWRDHNWGNHRWSTTWCAWWWWSLKEVPPLGIPAISGPISSFRVYYRKNFRKQDVAPFPCWRSKINSRVLSFSRDHHCSP